MYWNTFTVPYGHGNNKINIYFSLDLTKNIIQFMSEVTVCVFFRFLNRKLWKKLSKVYVIAKMILDLYLCKSIVNVYIIIWKLHKGVIINTITNKNAIYI